MNKVDHNLNGFTSFWSGNFSAKLPVDVRLNFDKELLVLGKEVLRFEVAGNRLFVKTAEAALGREDVSVLESPINEDDVLLRTSVFLSKV